jgi:GWxTD domain-containing protein
MKHFIWNKGASGVQHLLAVLLILNGTASVFSQAVPDDSRLQRQGKKWIRQRNWEKARGAYSQLLDKYPSSFHADDAQFWIGFSWEQIQGMEEQAFQSYQKLVDNHPDSPWADDAIVHQIVLARKMVGMGEESYRNFLVDKISDTRFSVRYQAALALGELRDPQVIPILEEIAKGEDAQMAGRAMDLLKKYDGMLPEPVTAAGLQRTKEQPAAKVPGAASVIAAKLLRGGEKWSMQELYDNGLFHIIEEDELAFYLSLENEWDRKSWWRKYWAPKDPTPTTPENEAEDEFKRRVRYARENFGRDWGFETMYYPPWDSRGEVYIKFGKPDRRAQSEMGWEEWTYHRYRLMLLVSDHDNRLRDGIYFGKVSAFLYRRNIALKRYHFIHQPQYLYTNPVLEQARKIRDMDLRIVSAGQEEDQIQILFAYQFPMENLKSREEGPGIYGEYRLKWVLYDEDYQAIRQYDAVEKVRMDGAEKDETQNVTGKIGTRLVPGTYILALRIEDLNSDRLGMYRKHFSTQIKEPLE